jgi:drug/metabolite transporter (DMT)-like permease
MNTPLIWIKLGLTTFFWALMFYLGKYAVAYMSPESISGWRFLLAGLVLAPVVALREGIDWQGLKNNIVPLLIMAIVGIGGFNLALFHGLRYTSPINTSLIMALCPALIAVFGALLTGERIGVRQQAGLALGIIGVVVVITGGSLAVLLALSFQRGDLFILLAATCWAIYSTIPKRFITGLPSLQVTVGTVSLGGVLLSMYANSTQVDFFSSPPLGVIAAIVAMSLLGSVLAYIWWNDGVRQVGASMAAMFMNLVPIFAALIGVVLGQSIGLPQIVGAVLVIGGVWLATTQVASPARLPLELEIAKQKS